MNCSPRGSRCLLAVCLSLCIAAMTVLPAIAAKKLVYSQPNDGTTLDRTKAASVPDQNFNTLICEGLVRMKNGRLIPGIAEKWDVSADGTVYTFHLRPSRWSDGKPLTAKDFVYSFQRLMDPLTASPYAFIGLTIKNGATINEGKAKPETLGVEAIDDLTLKITLEAPADFFLGSLSLGNFAPVRRDMVETYGAEYGTTARTMACNGPFLLREYIPQNKKVLARNPHYWNSAAVKLDAIEILVVSDLMTALQMYQTGQLDFTAVPSTVFPKYKDKATTYVYTVEWMGFNTRKKEEKPWLANPDFVKAVSYAIDREKFTRLASRGLNLPAQRYVMPGLMGTASTYGEDFPLAYYNVRADKEKALFHLHKAMKELGISDPKEIEISYQVTAEDADLRRQAEVLQSMVAKTLGITFHVTQVEYKHHWASLREGDYETAWQGWVPDYDSPYSYLDIWKSGGYYAARCGYANKEYDMALAGAMTSANRNVALKRYFEAEKILLDTAPIVPLQLRRKAMLVNPKIKNLGFYFIGFDIDAAFADRM